MLIIGQGSEMNTLSKIEAKQAVIVMNKGIYNIWIFKYSQNI